MRQACTHPAHSVSGPPRKCTTNARVHSIARRVQFAPGAVCPQAEAAKLDAAIAANLRELGYGG